MTPLDEIRSFWRDSLQTISQDVVRESNLSSETKNFLSGIGLPKDVSTRLNHTLEVNFYVSGNSMVKRKYNQCSYWQVGDDTGTSLCISEDDNKVYSIDFRGELTDPYCLVNSSIWQFVHCLQTFSEFQKLAAAERDQEKVLQAMIARFNEIDEECLSHQSTWWSVIIHQPY